MTVKPLVAGECHGRGSLVDAVRPCASIASKCVMGSLGKSSLRLGRRWVLAVSTLVTIDEE